MAPPASGGWWGHQGWAPYHQSQRWWFRPGRRSRWELEILQILLLKLILEALFFGKKEWNHCLWIVLIDVNVYYVKLCSYYFSILYVSVVNIDVLCDTVCAFRYIIGILEKCEQSALWEFLRPQEEKECILQDMNRVYAYCAFAFSCFIAQLSFVLKKILGAIIFGVCLCNTT